MSVGRGTRARHGRRDVVGGDASPRRPARHRSVALGATAALAAAVVAASAAHSAPPSGWPGGRWRPEAASYGSTVVQNVPVTMDDGVVLPVNVGYPTDPRTGRRAAGRFPVLLVQDPYIFENQPESYFVQRGYIMAVAEVRGTGDSSAPGNRPLAQDLFGPRLTRDGVELVDWAAHRLDGSNGAIGLYGCSFLGIDQLFTAAAVGPDSPVRAMIPACASNSYGGIYFAGGIPAPTVSLFGVGPLTSIDGFRHLPENSRVGAEMAAEIHAGGPLAYNGTYWQQRTTSPAMAAQIVRNGIPALLWSGWQAPDSTGSLELYAAMQNAYAHRPPGGPMAGGQAATGRYQVVIGPWLHGTGLDTAIELEWYDTWLKHEDTGMASTATPMHLYEGGTARWVNASGYPIVHRYRAWYLRPAGALADAPAPAGDATVAWGSPSRAGDSISYTTPVFAAGATVAGPVAASVYAASSNTNLELIATLQDLAPDGTATRITSGALLGSLADEDRNASWSDDSGNLILPVHPYAADRYLRPGQVRRYDITLFPAVWGLAPGHALRLVISTQADPVDCLGAILGPPQPCGYTAPQQATLPGGTYRIEDNARYPSMVALPLSPYRALAAAPSGTTPSSAGVIEPLGW